MAKGFKKSEFEQRKGVEGLCKVVDAKLTEGTEFGTIPDPETGQPVKPKNWQAVISAVSLETGEKSTSFIKITKNHDDGVVLENAHGAPTIWVGWKKPNPSSPFSILMASAEEADPSFPDTLIPEGDEFNEGGAYEDAAVVCDVAGFIDLNINFIQEEQPGVVNKETGEEGKPYYRTKITAFLTDDEVKSMLKEKAAEQKKGAAPKAAAKATATTASAPVTAKKAAKKAPEPEPEPEVEEVEETEEAGEAGDEDDNTAAIHEAIDEAMTKAINESATKVLPVTKLPTLLTPILRKMGYDNESIQMVSPLLADMDTLDEISTRDGCVWERKATQIKVRTAAAQAAPAAAAPAKKTFGKK